MLIDKTARHSLTHEDVCLKIEGSFSDLVSDACTLRYLAGGVGFPSVHWFGMLDEYDVLAIDLCGPSLEHVFNGLGYKFDLRYLYILADQLLTRLEFAHSRFTVHGNLNPHSVYFGCFPWQRQQIVLSCPVSCPKPRYCFRDDLLALGDLLHYLSSDATSWVDFQRDQYDGRLKKRSDIFDDYMDAVSSENIPDYAALRRIFHNAHQRLELHSIPIPGLSNTLELESESISISGLSAGELFTILEFKLSDAGRKIGDPAAAWSQQRGINLLQTLPGIMQLYTELLIRHSPCCLQQNALLPSYHLPNRLWLDLRWYVCNVRYAPAAFKKAIVRMIYRYITVLLEVAPLDEIYWMSYLVVLAHIYSELEVGFQRRNWEHTRSYWQNRVNRVKIEGPMETVCPFYGNISIS